MSQPPERMPDEMRLRAVEGDRRSKAWLRLRLLGNADAETKLMASFTGPMDWLWVCVGFSSVGDFFSRALGAGAAPDMLAEHRRLHRERSSKEPAHVDWPAMAKAWLPVVEALAAQHYPREKDRLGFYELGAREMFAAGDPNSPRLREIFGE